MRVRDLYVRANQRAERQSGASPGLNVPAGQLERGTGPLPLMSWAVGEELQADLGDPWVYSMFVRTYMRIWPDRYARLATAVRNEDQGQAMDAVLSISSPSQMIGALRLAEAALILGHMIRDGNFRAAGDLLHDLKSCGEDTLGVLSTRTPVPEQHQVG